ncbi:hypothetical protein QNA08_05865 [Chelatococcus sp. SYSU_G07232]|uniref:Uncharacterized protein n=1 Tax=Chelatococcus albus TaxID=3047466 RepID=A0ABT7AEG4_9HYPH|nr:hypothetical protein [Chelatococcus sp. SYSU_G07232]MDJ1157755.1 hypothetical protein [Chelatococcus sp. SYSU_G07232]
MNVALRLRRFLLLGAVAVAAPAAAQKAKPDAKGAGATPPAAAPAKPTDVPPRALPTIERDVARLPLRVAAMREAILDAAATGDAEKLRLVLERNEMPPVLARGQKGDAIAGLKRRSGDGEARETLGLLTALLEAPYVRIGIGTAQEMYVWPWFAEYPPQSLTPEQLVEVYRILRAGEFKESLAKGKYVSWRLGIGPDGTWHYFFTGE